MDLLTLSQYKAFFGISGTSQDAQITALIGPASERIAAICNRSLIVTDGEEHTHYLNAPREGCDTLIIPEFPVVTLSIYEDVTRGFAADTLLVEGQEDDYSANAFGRIRRLGTTWPHEAESIKIVLEAGYELADLPKKFQWATACMVKAMIASQAQMSGVTAVRDGMTEVRYAANSPGLKAAEKYAESILSCEIRRTGDVL